MENKNNPLFEIVKHHKFSWSYFYIINGNKRDIHGDSLADLKRKVLEKDLPWDNEKYPEEKITESEYDSNKLSKKPTRRKYYRTNDLTQKYEESRSLKEWSQSLKKRYD